jgi:hypothetical protein
MQKFITKPKYDGYKIKCRTCQCNFFAPFADVDIIGYDGPEYVNCPNCNKRIYRSLFWKKHKSKEESK